jgi:hypothetical protein
MAQKIVKGAMMTQKIVNERAQFIEDRREFRAQRIPGSFYVAIDKGGNGLFWYCCPCGCGEIGALKVGVGFKPEGKSTWCWNGSTDAPDLSPSINHVDHWHGYLDHGGKWRLA